MAGMPAAAVAPALPRSALRRARQALITVGCIGVLGLSVAATAADPCDNDTLAPRALELINRLRAAGAVCGGAAAAPAPPLEWSAAIAEVARGHAQDMALQRRLAHASSDGRHGGERLRSGGLEWQRWAENLALGHRSLEHVVKHWSESAVHCENLMQPQMRQVGLACVPDVQGRLYWALSVVALR